MIYDIQDFLKRFFKSRLFVLSTVMFLMFAVILLRVFSLQIVNGQTYQDNFVLKIEKTLSEDATRGRILDCNGKVLAYNELAYSVTISDNGTYKNDREKSEVLNPILAEISQMLHKNDEKLHNEFKITLDEDGNYEFNVKDNQLKRFLADVFGESSYDDLKYNEKYQFNEATATAEQVMQYLCDNFFIDENYDQRTAYDIVVIRYAMKSTTYSRYQPITIAQDVSDKTIAYVHEHSDTLTGVEIEEHTIRKYNDSIYFASIIGYTGTISESEYYELKEKDDSYRTDDTVGKSGLEQYYESYLRGTNGEKVVYVDSMGRIQEVVSSTEPSAGSDVYISIDSDLQKATYKLLEQEIAGIVYSNIKSKNISITDVYVALVENNVVDVAQFDDEDASTTEKAVHKQFKSHQSSAINMLKNQFYSSNPKIINDMSEELLDYVTYVIDLLKTDNILLTSKIDTSDEVYVEWRNGTVSPKDYLHHCISKQWIDIAALNVDTKYADTSEVYDALCNYVLNEAKTDRTFTKYVYKYMVKDGTISGRQLCLLLFEQGVLDYDDDTYNKINNGSLNAYNFILKKINNIEITPAQLALDPCTGSCIITDTKTGAIKAMVSYPGYDNNMLANGVDAEYYAKLNDDKSNPQWNYATQERTAPGSTFKMVSSAAGLAENIISTSSQINCTGVFEEVDNKPKCWIYPGGRHGNDTVSEALRDSCNIFYYQVGYDLSTKKTGVYNDANGIKYLEKYASIFGLNEKTGLEIAESQSELATEYPVMAAIGQSNNNITTAALSRYVTAVSTGKLYDYQLMSKIVDFDGNVVEKYEAQYENISNTLSSEEWSNIRRGMKMAAESYSAFKNFEIPVAAKTGTAQQQTDRPNHALFVGYAPYDEPEISISVRIAYGYTSSNAAAVSKNILAYYFETSTLEEMLKLKASGVNSSSNNNITD